jgi:hypothetical protein
MLDWTAEVHFTFGIDYLEESEALCPYVSATHRDADWLSGCD